MLTNIEERCNTVEECYEFTLSYAAQGLSSDLGSESGRLIREHLGRAVEALSGLEQSCATALKEGRLKPAERYEAFFAVLARDAQSSIAAIELVLVQPSISSQLIDNLNASIHLRALLTDLFLVTEILQMHRTPAESMVSS
jgi:hypothetical protein